MRKKIYEDNPLDVKPYKYTSNLHEKQKNSKNKDPRVSIVFVTWNGKKYSFDLLDSIKKIDYLNYDVIVSDNGSTDGTQKDFKKFYAKFATLIENKKNLGLAEGLNRGIREALKRGSKYIFIMNNDMVVKPNFLNILVDTMEKHPEVAAVGPKIYFMDPPNMFYSTGYDEHLYGFSARNPREIDHGQAETEEYTDAIDCCYMMKSTVLKKYGVLDTKLFLFQELTGWCMKARKFGYKLIYAPKSVVWHRESSSPAFENNSEKDETNVYYVTRNWLLVIKDNKNMFHYLTVVFLQSTIFAYIKFVRYIKKGKPELVLTYYKGILDALLKKTPLKLYPYKD